MHSAIISWTLHGEDKTLKYTNSEVSAVLNNPSRFVMTEKTIELKKLWNGEIKDALNELPSKLWKMISLAQAMKISAVENQNYDLAGYCRDVERNGALIILHRMKSL